MKRKSAWFGVIGLLLTAALLGAFTQSGEDLFQKALRLERNEGKLIEAIELYNKVVAAEKDTKVAAQAQLRIGLCYEKLGQESVKQAQEAFQKVLDNFPGQMSVVKVAKEKLSILLSAKKAARKGAEEFSIRKVMSLSILGGVSPDGRLLSYVDWDTGNGELGVMDTATGKKRCLTQKDSEDDPWHFVSRSIFSPDGKKLAFTRWKADDTTDFRIINADGSGQRVLLEDEEICSFMPNDWTPDGKYILGALQKKDKKNKIAYVSAVDGSLRIIKEFDKSAPGKLILSSDGRWIAYDFPQDEKSRKRNIFLLSEDGNREIPLLKHTADDRLLGWAPGGDWILFSSDRSGSWDAWVIPVSDGKTKGDPTLVKQDFGQMRGIGLQPMGFTQNGSFYFGDLVWLENIYLAEVDTEKTEVLKPPKKMAQRFEGSNCDPVWSSDGKSLAYLSRRERQGLESSAICIMNMDSGEEIELLPKLRNLGGLRWLPDGKSFIVLGTDENDQTGLFRLEARTGEIDLVVTGDSGYHAMRCSPDGKKVFYEADLWKEKIFRIIRYDIDTQQKKVVYKSDWQIFRMDLSPDGKQLVFYEGKDDALKIISVDGGQPRVLLKLEDGGINSVAWSADGKDIFFSKTIEGSKVGKCELWRIPSEGGEPVKFDFAEDGLIDLNIHPGGSLIAFTLWQADEEVWVMENFLPKGESLKK
jgi:Tol biopolymer transport system component